MSRYSIRVLEPHHYYPAEPIVIDSTALLASGPFSWSAVKLLPEGAADDLLDTRVGDISWLSPEEIRFFAAVSLSEAHPRTNGFIFMHTWGWPSTIEINPAELLFPSAFLNRTKEAAEAIYYGQKERPYPTTGPQEVAPIARDFEQDVRGLLNRIDPADSLLHRGLCKFLMAAELRQHRKFLEESALAAFISREAALELLRRKLSKRRLGRFRIEDVLRDIQEAFPTGVPFVEVLQTDWEARVLMTHPMNEFGEYWSPPVEADECYDSLYTCVYLYRYLLLDEVWTPAEYD